MRRVIFWLIVLVAAAVAPAAMVRAQPGGMAWAAEQVPGDVSVFVGVERAAEWRKEPTGALAWELLGPLVSRGGSGEAWARLSAQLGMSEAEAFDALLGQRVAIAQRMPARAEAEAGARSSWVILSTVDAATERLIRERLKPAPRRALGGLAVMSVEDGAFWLVSAPDGPSATLLLGPSGAPELFEQIAPTLGRRAEKNLAGVAAFGDLRALDRRAGALVMVRMGDKGTGWAGCSLRSAGRDLSARVLVRTDELRSALASVKPWSRRPFDEVAPGAFLAEVEWALPDEHGTSLLASLLPGVPIFAKPFEGSALLSGRRVLLVRPSEDGVFGAALALETSDVRALAPLGDRQVAGLLAFLAPARDAAGGDLLDYGGAFPDAERSVDLSRPIGAALGRAFERGPVMAWKYERALEGASVAEGVAPGWWTVGVDRAAAGALSAALTRQAGATEKRAPWVGLGVARPSALAAEVARRGIELPPPLAPVMAVAKRIESAEWELVRSEDGAIVGTAVVRVGQ